VPTETLSGWQRLARAEFPQGRIEGDGPFALVPCNPTGKCYLFWTRESALAVRDGWPCQPLCFGSHKCIELRQPSQPRPQPEKVGSLVWERD
jgi:hypothetical protein